MSDNTLSVDPELVRMQMRRWATGVTIVTSVFEGVRHGMTVSSFTSITLEPPRLMVSIARLARTHRLIDRSRIFGVTILERGGQEISETFAGRVDDDQDRFWGLETFALDTGAPFVRGGLAYFDCRVRLAFDIGDVTLFVGEVVAVKDDGNRGLPLIYYNREYHGLG